VQGFRREMDRDSGDRAGSPRRIHGETRCRVAADIEVGIAKDFVSKRADGCRLRGFGNGGRCGTSLGRRFVIGLPGLRSW